MMTPPEPKSYKIPTISNSRWGGLVLGLVVLAGCGSTHRANALSSLPDPAVPASPPGRVEIFVPESAPPDPDTSDELTLDQLLAYADINAPAIKVARARSRRGEAEIKAASPLFQENPQIGAGVGNRTTALNMLSEIDVSVEQDIGTAGERALRMKAAKLTREVALAELDEARWSIHVALHSSFLDALIAREQITAAQHVVQFAEELDNIASRRIEAGEDSPLTRLVAQAELAQARERLVDAKRQETAARIRVAEIAGWPPDRLPTLRGSLPEVRPAPDLDILVRLAAEHHPSFRVRSLAVAEAESRMRLAGRKAWPAPTLGLAYSQEGGEVPTPKIWAVTLGIPFPLWNRNQGERAGAEVALDVARTERDALHRSWWSRLDRVAVEVNAAAQSVAIYGTDIVPTVETNLALIRRAYELGEIDIQAVSQTRERVLESQQRAIDAQAAYVSALAEIEGLLGTEVEEALQEITQ